MKVREEELHFRVRPEDRALYYDVLVYPTLTRMREAVDIYKSAVNSKMGDGTKLTVSSRRYLAITCSRVLVGLRTNRVDPSLGAIFLARPHIGGGVVSHEATHATRYYFQRLKKDISKPEMDEPFAWVVGNIVSQIGRRVW